MERMVIFGPEESVGPKPTETETEAHRDRMLHDYLHRTCGKGSLTARQTSSRPAREALSFGKRMYALRCQWRCPPWPACRASPFGQAGEPPLEKLWAGRGLMRFRCWARALNQRLAPPVARSVFGPEIGPKLIGSFLRRPSHQGAAGCT